MMRRIPVLITTLVLSTAATAFAADPAAGLAVYDGAKPVCKGCHSDTKNPLTKAGADNTVDELKAWVRTPKQMIAKKGKKGIMPAYGPDKIADADLENLVAYLATMK